MYSDTVGLAEIEAWLRKCAENHLFFAGSEDVEMTKRDHQWFAEQHAAMAEKVSNIRANR